MAIFALCHCCIQWAINVLSNDSEESACINVEGSDSGLMWRTVSELSWKDWGKSRPSSSFRAEGLNSGLLQYGSGLVSSRPCHCTACSSRLHSIRRTSRCGQQLSQCSCERRGLQRPKNWRSALYRVQVIMGCRGCSCTVGQALTQGRHWRWQNTCLAKKSFSILVSYLKFCCPKCFWSRWSRFRRAICGVF